VGETAIVSGMFFLTKADRDSISPLDHLETNPRLYRALCEHPRVIGVRDPYRQKLGLVAYMFTRAIPSWELELTRHGNFWEKLGEETLGG
jgi:hypothetical protein